MKTLPLLLLSAISVLVLNACTVSGHGNGVSDNDTSYVGMAKRHGALPDR